MSALESLFNKAEGLQLHLKETPTQVNTAKFLRTAFFFLEHPFGPWLLPEMGY